jgi:hypothetical protein
VSGTFVGTPGSVQRDITISENRPVSPSPLPPSQLADNATRAEIAELAYSLWKERGCRCGSSEADWLEAEEIIQTRINPSCYAEELR